MPNQHDRFAKYLNDILIPYLILNVQSVCNNVFPGHDLILLNFPCLFFLFDISYP